MQRRRFLLTGFTLAAASLAGCGGDDDDAVLAVRRNVTRLSAAERQAFVDTLHAMKKTPSAYKPDINAYDYFVATHVAAFDDDTNAHMCAAFLPWHREFLRRFDAEMRRVSGNPGMSLPYWDWQEPGSHRSIFTDDFLGGNGDARDDYLVKTGAFRVGLWPMATRFDDTPDEFPDTDGDGKPDTPQDRLSPRGLTRRYTFRGESRDNLDILDQYMAQHPRSELLERKVYDTSPYMESMEADPTDEEYKAWTAVSMRKYLEKTLHNAVHGMIGGQMNTGSSPNDPAFFLHHANIDRLWDVWQQRYGDAGYPTAAQSPETGIGSRLNVFAEAVQPQETFDLALHSGVRYEV